MPNERQPTIIIIIIMMTVIMALPLLVPRASVRVN